MMTRRRLFATTVILALAILGVAVWCFGWFDSPYEAKAELRVRPRSEFELLTMGGTTATDDRWDVLQELRQILTSRSVVFTALRQNTIKDHPIIRNQSDPEGFVIRHLEVAAYRPSAMIVTMSHKCDPQFCSDLVNAIVDSFVSEIVARDVMQKQSESEKLRTYLDTLQDEYRRRAAKLEVLRATLGNSAHSGDGQARIRRLNIEVDQLTRAADAAHHNLTDARLSEAEMDSNWERDTRLEKLRRLEEEYQRIMADLEKKLAQLPIAHEGTHGSVTLATQEDELDRLRRQIDTINEKLAQAELSVEFGPRIELVSPARKPTTRRGWFGRSVPTD
ncbi:MAG: GumC domain-containing protein [Pirellulaceae bacterium]